MRSRFARTVTVGMAGIVLHTLSLAPALAKSSAELACEKQCAPLIKSVTPQSELRRVYHNCKTGCMPWTEKSFYICPDGIGYPDKNPKVCNGKTKKN